MANEVKILINAVDNASKSMGGIMGSFTEFNSAIGLLEKGLGYADKAFDATVGELLKYSEQVEDLSRVTGMSADETSRMIQTADDLFVEFGALKTAARQLASQGLIPNIETMATLSDKYLSFTNDTERAQWATKQFGRNYAEMTKILEAGGEQLRKMGAETPGGLILNEKDLADARKFKQELDTVSDSLKSLAMSAGKIALPAITGLINSLNNLHRAVYIQWKDGGLNIGTKEQLEAYVSGSVAQGIDNIARAYTGMAEAQEEVAASAQSLAQDELAALSDAVYGLDGAERIYTDGLLDQIAIQQQATGTISEATAALNAQKLASDAAAISISRDLAGAMEALQAAQESWNLSVASAAVSAIENTQGLSDAQIRILKAAIDSTLGSTYLATSDMNAALAAAVEDFKETGDVTQYQKDVQTIADAFESTLAPAIKEAEERVANLQHALDILNNTVINVPVHVNVDYPNGPIPTGEGGTTSPGTGSGTTPPPYTPGIPYAPSGGGSPFVPVVIITKDLQSAAIAGATARTYRRQRINTRMGG